MRKRWWIAVAALALLGVAAALWWFVWVPNWRPPLEPGERYGIDVSNHQGEVDWERVAADDMEFAYIKATEGGDFVDESFEMNWRGAEEAGLERGVYHFFTLCTPGDAQAENFLRVAPPTEDALPPAIDLEIAGNCSERPSQEEVARELEVSMGEVESAWERDAVLYVGDDWESEYPVRDRLERLLWHRRFLLKPNVDDWWIWQLHGYARVDGVEGGVDLNVMRDL